MTGPWLVLLGHGRGDADVDDTPYVARGHGREETFQRNIADWSRVRAEVARKRSSGRKEYWEHTECRS